MWTELVSDKVLWREHDAANSCHVCVQRTIVGVQNVHLQLKPAAELEWIIFGCNVPLVIPV